MAALITARNIESEMSDREWSFNTDQVRGQFRQEVYTLKTWVNNNPNSPRVPEVLGDLIVLLKTLRIMADSTDNQMWCSEQIEYLETVKEHIEA